MSVAHVRASMAASITDLDTGIYKLPASKILVGYNPQTADENRSLTLLSEGPYLVIKGAKRVAWDHQRRLATYEITSFLHIGIPRETANDLTDIDILLDSIMLTWDSNLPGYCENTYDEPSFDWSREPVEVISKLSTKAILSFCNNSIT